MVPIAGAFGVNKAKASAPPPPDYMGLDRQQAELQKQYLNEQTQANRPGQNTPFASSAWTRGPNGEWQQNVSLNGKLGEAANAVQGQVADQLGKPLDFSGLPEVGTGESARKQASDAAYQQATSRLDPQWRDTEEQNRVRLLNQGLAEGSEAYNKAMGRLSQQRNDAYNQANFSSIREGTSAGQALFGQNMAARNQAMQELLRARSQPLSDAQALHGFTAMPGFSQAGQAQAPNLLGAAGMQDQANMSRYQQQQQQLTDTLNAFMQMIGTGGQIAGMASDERVKDNLQRLPYEALPGVPFATWNYKPGYGNSSTRYLGVVAQDLQKVAPDHVHDVDGVLHVSPRFNPIPFPEE